MDSLLTSIAPLPNLEWPYPQILVRLGLALALGLLVGIERERAHKEAGLRTFGFVTLMGAIGGALGEQYALASLLFTGLLIVFLNLQTLRAEQGTELTTSAALLIACFAGILCGQGHTLTPAAVIVIVTALLAWKQPMAGFSIGLTESELRSALLLAILAIVIYPALPQGAVGPGDLLFPRQAWLTVLLIAGIGFVNYVLWKIYGQRGTELAAFLGGLINSRIAVSELASRVNAAHPSTAKAAYRGSVLAMAAMIIRNGVVLGILAPLALLSAVYALVSMLLVCAASFYVEHRTKGITATSTDATQLPLQSPFSLWSALKYGALFVFLQIVGELAQTYVGENAFYLISFLGGLASSASSLAAAANLGANGTISPHVAGTGAIIATLTSVVSNLPFVFQAHDRSLSKRLTLAIAAITITGIIAALIPDHLT